MIFHWMQRFNWENDRKGLLSMSSDLENNGIYSVLLPYGSTGPDYFAILPEMLMNTKKLRFMMAVRPYAISPEWAAKTYKTLKDYSNRTLINVVAGRFSPEEEDFVFKNYPGNLSDIETVEKRLEYSKKWVKTFYSILAPFRPESYTIGNSNYSLDLGNELVDAVIFGQERIDYNVKNAKPGMRLILIIDPLIIDSPEDIIEYVYQPTDVEIASGRDAAKVQNHSIQGTYEEVKQQLRDMVEKYGIVEFLVHTDQKDISKILKLTKELSIF